MMLRNKRSKGASPHSLCPCQCERISYVWYDCSGKLLFSALLLFYRRTLLLKCMAHVTTPSHCDAICCWQRCKSLLLAGSILSLFHMDHSKSLASKSHTPASLERLLSSVVWAHWWTFWVNKQVFWNALALRWSITPFSPYVVKPGIPCLDLKFPSNFSLHTDRKFKWCRYIPEPATAAEHGSSVSPHNSFVTIGSSTVAWSRQ